MISKNAFIVASLIIILLLVPACVDLGGNPQTNESTTEKKEITTITNITEKPKPKLNISKLLNNTYINYSKYKEKEDLPINIYFLNAGGENKNGRVIIIKKGDFDMVIDTGIKERYNTLHYLISSISDDIEVLVVSSPIEENLENLKDIMNSIGVGEIWYSEEEGLEDIINYAKEKNIALRKVKEGDKFTYNGIDFEVINPEQHPTFEDKENNAIVMKVIDRGISALITTDILDGAMGRISSKYGNNLSVDILEIPHYGDRVGQENTRLFIKNVNPNIAIMEGYEPTDIEESSKIATYNLLHDVYNIETYKTWNYNAVIITYDGKNKGVSFIEKSE